MALVSINPSRPRERGQSRLEQIATGLDIASKTLGLALAVPEFMQKRETGKLSQAESKATIGEKTEPSKQGEEGAFEVPGMGLRKPQPSLSRILQEAKVEETKPITPEMRDSILKINPSLKMDDIPVGLTIGEGRDILKSRLSQDPRMDLALKQYDLAIAQFNQGKIKEEKKDFSSKFDDIKSRVNKIKDKAEEDLSMATRAENLIKSGNAIGTAVAMTIIAKSVGKDTGAVSEGDVARYLPKSLYGSSRKIFNYLTGDTTTTLNPQEQEAMVGAVKIAAKQMRSDLANRVLNEIELQSAGDNEFFQDDRVKNYMSALEKQIPGIKNLRLANQLEKKLEDNPNDPRALEMKTAIQKLRDSF